MAHPVERGHQQHQIDEPPDNLGVAQNIAKLTNTPAATAGTDAAVSIAPGAGYQLAGRVVSGEPGTETRVTVDRRASEAVLYVVLPRGQLTNFVKRLRIETYDSMTARARRRPVASGPSALTAARMGTWEWNISSNEVYWSKDVTSIFGIPQGTFGNTYQSFLDLVHPEDVHGQDPEVPAAQSGGFGEGDFGVDS